MQGPETARIQIRYSSGEVLERSPDINFEVQR